MERLYGVKVDLARPILHAARRTFSDILFIQNMLLQSHISLISVEVLRVSSLLRWHLAVSQLCIFNGLLYGPLALV